MPTLADVLHRLSLMVRDSGDNKWSQAEKIAAVQMALGDAYPSWFNEHVSNSLDGTYLVIVPGVHTYRLDVYPAFQYEPVKKLLGVRAVHPPVKGKFKVSYSALTGDWFTFLPAGWTIYFDELPDVDIIPGDYLIMMDGFFAGAWGVVETYEKTVKTLVLSNNPNINPSARNYARGYWVGDFINNSYRSPIGETINNVLPSQTDLEAEYEITVLSSPVRSNMVEIWPFSVDKNDEPSLLYVPSAAYSGPGLLSLHYVSAPLIVSGLDEEVDAPMEWLVFQAAAHLFQMRAQDEPAWENNTDAQMFQIFQTQADQYKVRHGMRMPARTLRTEIFY